MLVDSHCHLDRLDLREYGGELSQALAFANEQGVTRFLCVGITLESFPNMMAMVESQPNVYATVGVHPNEQEGRDPTVAELVELAKHPRIVGIGETGLDHFRSQGDLEWQRARFRNHIAAAKQCGMPLIIHSRDAHEDTLAVLRESGVPDAGGVMHCYAYDWDAAQAYLELGLHISLSGIVTFNNASDLREVAKNMPLDRLLVETDAPYLTPIPHRGKPNQPAFVRHVAEQIAEVRGMSLEDVATQTSENFRQLFQLPD